MKTSELISQLQASLEAHGDLPVAIEGCDCNGIAESVSRPMSLEPDGVNYDLDTRDTYVLVQRCG